jgi:hypothetical protein
VCCVEENDREDEGEGEHDEDERGILVVEEDEGEERYGRRELETRCDCIRGGIVGKCKVDGRPAHEQK